MDADSVIGIAAMIADISETVQKGTRLNLNSQEDSNSVTFLIINIKSQLFRKLITAESVIGTVVKIAGRKLLKELLKR